MPSILEYSKAFYLLKRAVRFWCRIVGGWLQLDSYLLPMEKDHQDEADQREQQRQRARERLLRGDQEEQIGLMEALEAIEDDTTEDEGHEDRNNLLGERENSSDNDIFGEEDNDLESISAAEEVIDGCEIFHQNHAIYAHQPKILDQLGDAMPQPGEFPNNQEGQSSSIAAVHHQHNAGNGTPVAEPLQQEDEVGEREEQQQAEQQRLNAQQRLQRQMEERNLGAQHQAMLNFRDPKQSDKYIRPNFFAFRIILLLFFVSLTAQFIALLFFFVPGEF